MTIIIAYKKDWSAIKEQLDLEYDHVFVSPQGATVDYTADHVIIVGEHPTIEKKYKGVCKVEKVTIETEEE